MKIVLFEPKIPQNAGNIARTCAITHTDLIMVKPLGFSTSDRMLKRAGLDYWQDVSVSYIEDLNHFLENKSSFYFFSSKATNFYHEITYNENDILIFGSETAGLPSWVHKKWPEKFAKIPMRQGFRSLNLANSVSIVLYEALRQQEFPGIC